MFAEKFKKFLQENNMSIYALSKEVGIPQTTMNNWVKRGSKPNIEDVVKICEYFSVSIDYLIGRESEDGIIIVNDCKKYTPEEENLIISYRKLSSKKKEALLDYVRWQLS